ncbi:hypothetical protein HS1genome_0133 [Sulfodiicoccus acidiphilus]|uniref:Uncharacterized protein n=1 Tax=Sulfodiicoccus acidiphilus TaxID=1670455 RepID=A0A348B0P2_9CREN|nr:hypothetical protein [Sulfodiicoccus acidiphilus]BBD71744.1 hypothetical protein HS1genome_0133 [Sulfodiicoccus acidiphilus]GGT86195.1 hypothetical protein GCM10007116_00140 [Sulfodiicoccus acidiphilus]
MKQLDMKSLVSYVALKVLGGSDFVLDALEEYLVKGDGPATVAHRYSISKHQLRGYAQRVTEKSGGELRAKKIVPILREIFKDTEPVVSKASTGMFVCKICGQSMPKEDTEEHIRKFHKEVVVLAIKNSMQKLENLKKAREQVIFTSTNK